MNGKSGKFTKTVFLPESCYSQLTRSENHEKTISDGKGMGSVKIKFASRKTLLDKLKYVLKQLY